MEAVEALPACLHSSVYSALEVNFKKLLKVLLNHNIIIQKHNLQKAHHHIWIRVSETSFLGLLIQEELSPQLASCYSQLPS